MSQANLSRISSQSSLQQLKRSHFIADYRFNPKQYVTRHLKEQDIIQLKQVFDALDEDKMGILTPNQIQYILVQNGFPSDRDTIYDLVGQFSENEFGGLEFQDFVSLMARQPKSSESEKNIDRIFRKYDRKQKGYIEFQDIKNISNQLQANLTDNEINTIIKECGGAKEGKITLEEFKMVMFADVYNEEYDKRQQQEFTNQQAKKQLI